MFRVVDNRTISAYVQSRLKSHVRGVVRGQVEMTIDELSTDFLTLIRIYATLIHLTFVAKDISIVM